MSWIFLISFLIILVYLPSLIIYSILIYVSNNIIPTLSFESNGYLKYSCINFYIDNDFFFFALHIDTFQIYLIWLRIRINLKGLKVTFSRKTTNSTLVKTKPISKKTYSDSFVIKRKSNAKGSGYLASLKESFFSIIREKYIMKHIKYDNQIIQYEEEMIDNLIKKSEITRKDKFIRNLLVMFDFLIENVELNYKLSQGDFYYSAFIRKSVIGAIKGLNKHKEIHLMVLGYDIEIKEYVSVNSIKFRKSFGWKSQGMSEVNDDVINNPFEAKGHSFDSYAEFVIVRNKKLYINAKLEYGLFPMVNLSLENTLNVKAEVNQLSIDFSVRFINTLIKLVNEMTKYRHYMEYKTNSECEGLQSCQPQPKANNEITFRIECVEENILNFVASQIKKIKVHLNDVNIRVLSDNHNYIFTGLHIDNLQYKSINHFNFNYDSHKLKLLKSIQEIKLTDVLLSANKRDRIIMELQSYTFSISKELIYYHSIREAQTKTLLMSEMPNISIIMTTRELDKFVEIFVVLICGLEKIEAYTERGYYQTKYTEEMHEETMISFRFDNVSMIVYDEKIQGELANLSLSVKIDEKKFKRSKVEVLFSPVYINVFRKYSSKYASNCIIKGFKLNITDDLKTSHIDVLFEDTKVLIYDDHMIDILKFVADFLTYNLRYSVKRKYKLQIQKEEIKLNPNRKDTTFLKLETIIVYNVVDFKDIFTLKINDFKYQIDEWMSMPQVKIYHQSTTNPFLKRRNLGLLVNKFHIRFHPDINELEIDFGQIVFNIYCFELIHPVLTMFTYYHFFPLWIIYHMNYKYRVDEDYKLIYIAEFAKKDKVMIKFEEIIININQSPIANAAILQIEPYDMLNCEKTHSRFLREKRCEQMQVRVRNFTMATHGFYVKEINKGNKNYNKQEGVLSSFNSRSGVNPFNSNNNIKNELDDGYVSYFDSQKNIVIMQNSRPYYNKLSKKGRLEMVYEQIDIYQEASKVVELTNFIIILGDTKIYDQFDLHKLNSISLTYKMHNIFYKEIKSRKLKYGYIEIYMDNLKLYLDDIKIIDKIALFTKKMAQCVVSYDFKDNSLEEIVDEAKIELHDKINIGMHNFETVVNSLDPVTGKIFNKLYLKVECLAMGKEIGLGYDRLQLSVYYLTFGFNYSKNNDYPMIILPIGEFSVDSNTLRVNVPSNCLRKLSASNTHQKTQLIIIDPNAKTTNKINENINATDKDKANSISTKAKEDKKSQSKLDQFIMNTQSFTFFLNFAYLQTFSKIFENFWKRSEFVRKYLFNSNNAQSSPQDNNNKSHNNKFLSEINNHSFSKLSPNKNSHGNKTINFSEHDDYSLCFNKADNNNLIASKRNLTATNSLRLFTTVFDLKIIYLINYKSDFDAMFQFHREIKLQGYFGYVIRLYSSALKYAVSTINESKVDELKVNVNLLTITVLNHENMNDDKFFKYDGDIKMNKFLNLKLQKNFNDYMELIDRKNLFINDVLFPSFECIDDILKSRVPKFVSSDSPSSAFADLPFDFQNTLIKIFGVSFKRDTLNAQKLEEIYTNLNEIKITWNKMNMDMLGILIFNDVLQIVDKILLKIEPNKKEITGNMDIINSSNNQNANTNINPNAIANINANPNVNASSINVKNTFDLGRFNFVFELVSLQVCIENEIKKSKVLLTTKSKTVLKLSKLCLNQNIKDFKLELSVKDMMVYIPPSLMEQTSIYWIGDKNENKFYLDTKLFNQMVSIPNITFTIKDQINSINDNIAVFNYIDINIDRLIGDFAHSYFENFMNIIEVFIFNRGNSFAEEKVSMDSRDNDLKKYKLEEIKKKIKDKIAVPSKIKIKQISFSLKDVMMTLLKDNKEIIKLLMRKFEGDHIIFKDKSSETIINVTNLKILDLLKIKNDTILSQTNENRLGSFENKIEMIRFRKKDSYVSIDTPSKWYVLDYLEIGVQSLFINITKYHCDFILEFFFGTSSKENKLTEDEFKNMLNKGSDDNALNSFDGNSMSIVKQQQKLYDSGINKSTSSAQNNKNVNVIKRIKEESNEVDYPIYFKHVKINETRLNVSFFFSDGSPWNLKEAKVKFTEFEKKDKFYANNILIYRLIHHLKIIAIQNVGNVLASMLFDRSDNTNKKKEDEESHKKLLFGSLYDK